MPEYLTPGDHVERIGAQGQPIKGVATSTVGFLGRAPYGPECPTLLSAFIDYQRWFGGHNTEPWYLSYAVQGFFDNGGTRCFVTRIVGKGAAVARATRDSLVLVSVGRGAWYNNLGVTIGRHNTSGKRKGREELFRVRVIFGQGDEWKILEEFEDVVFNKGASDDLAAVLNSKSNYLRAWWQKGDPPTIPDEGLTIPLVDGKDGDVPHLNDFKGDNRPVPTGHADLEPNPKTLLGQGRGLEALNRVDEIALVVAPDETDVPDLSKTVIGACEKLNDRFAIVSAPPGQSQVVNVQVVQDTPYGALYYPWIRVFKPTLKHSILIPPSGHVAGIFARTDAERGVHKAPANAVVRGVSDLEFPVTKAMQEVLNPRGVNCIRDFRCEKRGIRLWGARTMSSDAEWTYVNVRRIMLFIEKSIDKGTQWAVFEPNTEATWAKVIYSITNFLADLWRGGVLAGAKQDEAFFVKCDRTTMTQHDIDSGRLICLIGVAPLRPAEFIILRISQQALAASG